MRLATTAYAGIALLVSGLSLAGVTVVGPATASVLCAGTVSGLALGALTLRLERGGRQPRLRHQSGARG
ncbi:hypothetical protein [Nonomuraea lactucae]|uniref:hypothetical protein n=1 Tax=Nonomuraea lactucae TaxID=2249762 RepID=UPI000DE31955|nr:hypothetical protein [Nonomuraea lactucae]